MSTPDKITVNDSLASLDVETDGQPYRFALKGNKIITFPDPGAMPWDEAEEFINSMSDGSSLSAVMQRWLSEDDYQKLLDAKLTLRQMIALSQKVTKHYELLFGSPGEG